MFFGISVIYHNDNKRWDKCNLSQNYSGTNDKFVPFCIGTDAKNFTNLFAVTRLRKRDKLVLVPLSRFSVYRRIKFLWIFACSVVECSELVNLVSRDRFVRLDSFLDQTLDGLRVLITVWIFVV